MDWTQTLFDVIDTRSFSSLWYWIVLAVTWSTTSHWVLGVPYDMVMRAKKGDGATMADLEMLTRINVSRILFVARSSGAWLAGFAAFALTVLAILAFWYGVEFAQAVFLILLPLAVVGGMSLRAAQRLEQAPPEGEALVRALTRHRLWTQGVGMVAIFATAMFGMYQNLRVLEGL